jgi:ribonucleotide monophosphatase NagD (HAD superfamily)
MVGDTPEVDIQGGNNAGFETILVKTGNYKDGHDHQNAKHIVQDAYEAVERVLSLHY